MYMKTMKFFVIAFICMLTFGSSCKKDTTNIDKAVGKWTVSRYTDSGIIIQQYYLEIKKDGDNLVGTFTECLECTYMTYYVSKINFSKDAITFSYELYSGYINVNASLKNDKTFEGSWNDSKGEFGDWYAEK